MAPRWEPHRKQHCIPHPSTASRISAPHLTSRNGTGGSHTPPGWRHSRTCSPLAGDAINMRGALLIELLNTAAGHRNSSALRFHPKLDWNSQTGTFLIFFFSLMESSGKKYRMRKRGMSKCHIFAVGGIRAGRVSAYAALPHTRALLGHLISV